MVCARLWKKEEQKKIDVNILFTQSNGYLKEKYTFGSLSHSIVLNLYKRRYTQ